MFAVVILDLFNGCQFDSFRFHPALPIGIHLKVPCFPGNAMRVMAVQGTA